jgi:hypothetical protein
MCLSRVDEIYDHPSTLIIDGWKNFSGTAAKPKFEIYTLNGSAEVPLDKWIQAEDDHAKKIRAGDGSDYKSGFHVFIEEPDIKSQRSFYRRVFLRKITYVGIDNSKKTAIALEMYVPSEESGWPPKEKSVMDRIKSVMPGSA